MTESNTFWANLAHFFTRTHSIEAADLTPLRQKAVSEANNTELLESSTCVIG